MNPGIFEAVFITILAGAIIAGAYIMVERFFSKDDN